MGCSTGSSRPPLRFDFCISIKLFFILYNQLPLFISDISRCGLGAPFAKAVFKILRNSDISQCVTHAFCESCRSRARCLFCESCFLYLEKQRHLSVYYMRLLRELPSTGQVPLFSYTRVKHGVLFRALSPALPSLNFVETSVDVQIFD